MSLSDALLCSVLLSLFICLAVPLSNKVAENHQAAILKRQTASHVEFASKTFQKMPLEDWKKLVGSFGFFEACEVVESSSDVLYARLHINNQIFEVFSQKGGRP